MAINGRKISSFNTLNNLTGNEWLMVAYKNKTYKLPVSLLLGNKIESITQVRKSGDGEDNPITISLSDGSTYNFHVYNGAKGSEGPQGKEGIKGETGDSGIVLSGQSNEQILDYIIDLNEVDNYSDEDLTHRMTSAAFGKWLASQVVDLKEVYYDTQDEFDRDLAAGKIKDDTKYFIFEE
jgi:hypothetical protein